MSTPRPWNWLSRGRKSLEVSSHILRTGDIEARNGRQRTAAPALDQCGGHVRIPHLVGRVPHPYTERSSRTRNPDPNGAPSRCRCRHYSSPTGASPVVAGRGWVAGRQCQRLRRSYAYRRFLGRPYNRCAPLSRRGASYSVGWAFTANCDVGACNVQVGTTANACPLGQCAQPPSAFRGCRGSAQLARGKYKTLLRDNRRLPLVIGLLAIRVYSGTFFRWRRQLRRWSAPLATKPLRQVSAISGTLVISGLSQLDWVAPRAVVGTTSRFRSAGRLRLVRATQ